MQYSPFNPWLKHTSPLCDPLNVTAMALSGIKTGLSAESTIAGGDFATQAGQMKQAAANFQAERDIENAAGETASAQRQALDVSQKANLLRSSAVASAAAGGVGAGSGSALTNQAQIASRGTFQAGMDLWQGQNRATNLMNQATASRYTGYMDALSGEEAQRRSRLDSYSTLAGGGFSMLRTYGSAFDKTTPGGRMTWTDYGNGGPLYPMFT